MARPDDHPIAQLGWRQLTQQYWTDLVDRGLPIQLAELIHGLGERNERPIRAYTLPTMEAGIEGLAVPFESDDGILFDPSLLDRPEEMTRVVARELAVMLYPGWGTSCLEDYEEMKAFASVLGNALLRELPRRVDEVDGLVHEARESVRSARGGRRPVEGRRMSLRDESARQLRQSLHLSPDETDEERLARLDRYRRLLEQWGADTAGDEATLIARIGYLIGSPD